MHFQNDQKMVIKYYTRVQLNHGNYVINIGHQWSKWGCAFYKL